MPRVPAGVVGVCVVVRLGPPATVALAVRTLAMTLVGICVMLARGCCAGGVQGCLWVLCNLTRRLLLRWCPVLGL